LAGGAGVDARLDSQRRAHGLVLLRPHHPRICRGNLERAGAHFSSGAGAGRAARRDALNERKSITSDVIEFGARAAILPVKLERHCEEPTGRNDGKMKMLTKAPHLFDDATRVTAGDSRWQGATSNDYWAFV